VSDRVRAVAAELRDQLGAGRILSDDDLVRAAQTVGLIPQVARVSPETRLAAGRALGRRLLQGDRDADLFAGWLFLEADWALMEPDELAEAHRLPLAFVTRWLALRGPPVRLRGRPSDPWDWKWYGV
jgi:hypothetical protein